MRHKKAKFQLNRFTSWRQGTLISLAKAVLIHQSIKTTKTKAKAAKPLIEKLISLGKDNTLAAKRQAYRILGDHKMVSLLFGEIAPRFANRMSGYTRMLNLNARRGDNAKVAILEFTEIAKKERPKPKNIEAEAEKEKKPEAIKEARPEAEEKKEKPPLTKKPAKKFLGGLRGIFKRERDSL